jgi:hypothetical protein
LERSNNLALELHKKVCALNTGFPKMC